MILNINDFISKQWCVGGGLRYFEQIMFFINNLQDYYGLGGTIISSVYDSHAGLKWNGGRYLLPFQFSVEESVGRVKAFNNIGVGFNITFSNLLITEKDLEDRDCNRFLQNCEHPLNGVIVSSHLLKDYIRKNYPQYKIIASININFNKPELEFYKEIQDLYDLVVLYPDLNRNFDLIKQLDTSRLKILVNELCVENCKFRHQHSTIISKINKENISYFYQHNSYMNGSCLAIENGYHDTGGLVLTLEEIQYLNSLGIRHFKIQGREHDFNLVIKKALHKYILQGTVRELFSILSAKSNKSKKQKKITELA